MAFKLNINFKSIVGIFSLLLVSMGIMAQTTDATTAATTTATDTNAMWIGVGYYVLLFLIIVFIIAIIGKILKVYDLTSQIQGKKPLNWNNAMAFIFIAFLLVGLYGACWCFVNQGAMILPVAASEHGVKTDAMFMVTFGITVFVFFITQILLFSFVFKYRGSDKRKAYFYPHNNTIEKIWTVVPAIVLTVLVITGFFTWTKITNSADLKNDEPALNIDLTAHQFAWELRYPGKDGKLGAKNYKLISGTNKVGVDFTDKNSFDDLVVDTIVLPVNKFVRLNVIAQDVIHSVYMPHFRVQINAVPGLPTFFKFKPTITTAEMRSKLDDPKFEYLLYCNKICGASHYNMQRVVRIVTESEYQTWLEKQKPYLNDQLKKELKLAGVIKTDNGVAQNRLALNY